MHAPARCAIIACQWGLGFRVEAGSYLRLMDSCVTQLQAQGPSRTYNESKEEGLGSRVQISASAKVHLLLAIRRWEESE